MQEYTRIYNTNCTVQEINLELVGPDISWKVAKIIKLLFQMMDALMHVINSFRVSNSLSQRHLANGEGHSPECIYYWDNTPCKNITAIVMWAKAAL